MNTPELSDLVAVAIIADVEKTCPALARDVANALDDTLRNGGWPPYLLVREGGYRTFWDADSYHDAREMWSGMAVVMAAICPAYYVDLLLGEVA